LRFESAREAAVLETWRTAVISPISYFIVDLKSRDRLRLAQGACRG
jgi:hypothetical protein